MISFDFLYFRPKSVHEALQIYQDLSHEGLQAVFYNGGTEIISRARAGEVQPDAVIDMKGIADCQGYRDEAEWITIGAAVTLSNITDEINCFPLMQRIAKEIATRNARNKISIAGNVLSSLNYREALLPFLLTDSVAVVAGPAGIKEENTAALFANGSRLEPGKLLVQFKTEKERAGANYFFKKKTKQSAVNYPIATLCAMKREGKITAGFSGICTFPFKDAKIDRILNDHALTISARAEEAIAHLPEKMVNDFHASAGYRHFVLEQLLIEMLEHFEEVS
ncbi:FAD binding domain-containing protein [Virgibacillus sp. 179-BFC.A HS]|uniref:FAD binding domain-containing protein n=1 Tax=Tigheibacillus jepli TaxID=3035914 RepID=A0ABU5CJI1_9BACI|nr:FAD binding domain-containing protein [Virgibacillus sp. 179-BFC.A HS]MDY0405655.1 FAD binding domain-containing protein [Virgibacillus sp. 179-BFC.A HS]